ncbi:MAG: hypothetical protein ABII23_08635 [bacterium]
MGSEGVLVEWFKGNTEKLRNLGTVKIPNGGLDYRKLVLYMHPEFLKVIARLTHFVERFDKKPITFTLSKEDFEDSAAVQKLFHAELFYKRDTVSLDLADTLVYSVLLMEIRGRLNRLGEGELTLEPNHNIANANRGDAYLMVNTAAVLWYWFVLQLDHTDDFRKVLKDLLNISPGYAWLRQMDAVNEVIDIVGIIHEQVLASHIGYKNIRESIAVYENELDDAEAMVKSICSNVAQETRTEHLPPITIQFLVEKFIPGQETFPQLLLFDERKPLAQSY